MSVLNFHYRVGLVARLIMSLSEHDKEFWGEEDPAEWSDHAFEGCSDDNLFEGATTLQSLQDDIVVEVPLVPGVVTQQPPPEWFQFGEGSIKVVANFREGVAVDQVTVELYYAVSQTPVVATGEKALFRVVERLVTGSTLELDVKVGEISRNHRGCKFCLALCTESGVLFTDGFLVKTKRTKRKRLKTTRPGTDADYKRQARPLLERLQWTVIGYAGCDGVADVNSPIYGCPMCNSLRDAGHAKDCPIRPLL